MPASASTQLIAPYVPASMRAWLLHGRLRRSARHHTAFDNRLQRAANDAPQACEAERLRRRSALAWAGLALRLMAASAIVAAGTLAFAWAAVETTAYANRDRVLARHAQMLARATAVTFTDSTGVLLGATPQPGSADTRMILRVASMPKAFMPILVSLEDQHAKGLSWRHWFGIDVVSLARAPICQEVSVHLQGLLGRRLRCASSSLLMQSVRGSEGQVGGRGHGKELQSRKWREVADSASLSLVGGPLDPAMAPFVADRLGYAFGAGHTVWGLESAAQLIFGVPAERLTLAQQAVLAAAVRVQLRLVCDGDGAAAQQDALSRWRYVQHRAAIGLRQAFPRGGGAVDVASRDIQAMPLPAPHPLPAALVSGLSARDACLAAANLGTRAALVGGSAVLAARQELAAATRVAGGNIDEVRLTVDGASQRAFRTQVEATLRGMDNDQRHKLDLPLDPDLPARAEVFLAVVGPDGAVRQLYANTVRDMFDEPRRGGSIGKLPVALAAARAGWRLADPLCDLRDEATHVRNDDGDEGFEACVGPALIRWDTAFGRSLNLPVLKLARDLGDARLVEPARSFGFDVEEQHGLAHDLVTGEELLRPRKVLAAIQALTAGLAGAPATSVQPYVVASVHVHGKWIVPPRLAGPDLTPYLASNEARRLIGVAAGSSLRIAGGTLAGAVTSSAPLWPSELAKTGTVAGPRPAALTISKLVVGAGAGPAQQSYFGLIAAPRGALGDKIGAVRLWALLRSYASENPVGAPPPSPTADIPGGVAHEAP